MGPWRTTVYVADHISWFHIKRWNKYVQFLFYSTLPWNLLPNSLRSVAHSPSYSGVIAGCSWDHSSQASDVLPFSNTFQVSVQYLVTPFSEYFVSEHLPPCYYMMDCLRGCLCTGCILGLVWCVRPLSQPFSLFSYWLDFPILAMSFVYQRCIPCRGLVFHDTSSPLSVFCSSRGPAFWCIHGCYFHPG